MDNQKQNDYKNKLLEQQKVLTERVANLNEGLGLPMRESIGELSLYDNHPADIGDELFERGKDLSLRDSARIQAQQVERALKKMDEGSYGTCDRCGRPIGEDRLDAIPYANLCMDCKKAEEVPDRTPRPIEEQVIRPPYGEQLDYTYDRKFGDGDNDPAFDGEDSWQAVARFGSSDTPQDLADQRAEYPHVYDDWDEDVGSVEDVDAIQYVRDKDGMVYEK